jgi:hypothetical protein
MARGGRFTADNRLVLLLICHLYPAVSWAVAAEVFNLVFSGDHPRTVHALQQQMHHRRTDQRQAWDDAWANDTLRNSRRRDVEKSFDEARDPDRKERVTKESLNNFGKWTHDMRRVCDLLMKDKSLNAREKTRIWNALFREERKKKDLGDATVAALNSNYRKRNDRDEAKDKGVEVEDEEEEEEVEGPPRKKRKAYHREKKGLSVAESWAIILDDFMDEQEQRSVKSWQEKIEEHRGVKTMPEQSAPENRESPVYDPQQDVGHWEFVTAYDQEVTNTNIGAQIPGMPGHPSAEDVRRNILQWEGAGLLPWRAQGVNIEPVEGEASEDGDESDEEAEEGDQESNDEGADLEVDEEDDHQEDADEEDDEEAPAVQRTTRYVARHANAVGHWRFITEEDERLSATHLGGRPGMPARPSAWDVRRYRLREIRAGRFPHYAINHIWVYNRHEGQLREPMYETSREALLDYWYAVLKKIWEAEELNK